MHPNKNYMSGFYDHTMVRDMLKECSKMSTFDHVHVLTLKGVCLDGGPAPYIIMPFMANGSLLAYLRKNRKTLLVSNGNTDDVSTTVLNIATIHYL
jgi:serine/threonine protein kinase